MKILNLCPYWTYPPKGGGPLRVFNLNSVISKKYKVFQFSTRLTLAQKKSLLYYLKSNKAKINNNYVEYKYSNPLILSTSFFMYKLSLPQDILQSQILKSFPPNIIKKKIKEYDAIQVEHPWLFDFALSISKNKPLVFSSHNVEYVLAEGLIDKKVPYSKKALKKVEEIEKNAVERADVIFVVSREDLEKFRDMFNVDKNKMHIIPHCVDVSQYKFQREKEKNKSKLGLSDKRVALFIGGDHYPNKEALKFIKSIYAKKMNDVTFLIIGSIGKKSESSKNLIFTGLVDDITPYIMATDVAINPLISGSGASLKMIEYLSYGLPIVSSKVGARGLDIINGTHALIAEIEDFPEHIRQVLDDDNLSARLTANARQLAEKMYDSKIVEQNVMGIYEKIFNGF
ncbi:MAG: glycosyltransferase family 4 protein [Candidatus Hodarchaeota archaeon]